jgi:hypothetical protein
LDIYLPVSKFSITVAELRWMEIAISILGGFRIRVLERLVGNDPRLIKECLIEKEVVMEDFITM